MKLVNNEIFMKRCSNVLKHKYFLLVLLAILCCLHPLSVFGQEKEEQVDKSSYTSKGRIGIKGASSLTALQLVANEGAGDAFAANLGVSGEYFVANNISLGPIVSLSYQSAGDANWSGVVGAAARYYTKPRIFGGVGYLYSFLNDPFGVANFELGYAHFFNKHVSVEPSFQVAVFPDFVTYGLKIAIGVYF